MKNTVDKHNSFDEVDIIDSIELPQNTKLLNALKNAMFVEGVHYYKSRNSKGVDIIIFSENASSVIADLFNINIEVIEIISRPYYDPSYVYIMQNLLKMAENLIEKDVKSAETALKHFEELAKRENKVGLWKIEAKIKISNESRSMEWVGIAINSIIKTAQVSALNRAFKNGIKSFVGL